MRKNDRGVGLRGLTSSAFVLGGVGEVLVYIKHEGRFTLTDS